MDIELIIEPAGIPMLIVSSNIFIVRKKLIIYGLISMSNCEQ